MKILTGGKCRNYIFDGGDSLGVMKKNWTNAYDNLTSNTKGKKTTLQEKEYDFSYGKYYDYTENLRPRDKLGLFGRKDIIK